jgi:drug/metabolite transporter (DMT)-like permease
MRARVDRDRAALAAVALACIVWGASFLFAKLALAELPASHLVLWRFAIAAALLAPFAARRGLPRRRDLPLLALTGVLCVPVSLGLQFAGLARTSVASASLIVGTGTPILAVAGAIFRAERLGARGWWAVALSTVGLAVVVGLPGAGRTWQGDALVFASMVVTAAWVLLSTGLIARYGGLAATAWILGIGALVQAPIAWIDHPPIWPSTPLGWWTVLALAVPCTALAFALWNWGLERVEAGRAGIYINLEPVVGALLGIGFLGDNFGPALAVGGALVLLASLLASIPARRADVTVHGTLSDPGERDLAREAA